MRAPHFLLAVLATASFANAQLCSNTSVGFTPLSDLGAGTYAGFQGGLYPGGSNVRPAAHDAAGLAQAALVVPRDATGAPSPSGRIVFASIGMSNGVNEWTQFMPLSNADALRDGHVQVVMCAQGGQAANVIASPTAAYWTYVDSQLAAAGATPAQLQVVWIKEAIAGPTGGFPSATTALQGYLVTILQILKTRYPNLQIAYLTSRIYAGYATTSLNPEPYAYESGFAVKWTIEQQIAGSAALNYDASAGPVLAPWVSWGPYMWADGLVPRSDGLTWLCSDYNADGTHPNPTGSTKVANAILSLCHTDPSATAWYIGVPVAPGPSYCFGDGVDPVLTVNCPCSNYGGLGHGCANSADASGGLLVQNGTTNPDTIVLTATHMPAAASSLFLKGGTNVASGILFGDGVRCVEAPIVRLGTVQNSAGSAQYPPTGGVPVSVRGGNVPGSGVTAYYQDYYRNAAAFCAPATFNITNALQIVW
ncbi:MAG: hypothetical protein HZA53_04290 [Planctomycetes bacterium]|nr:hypothetical protein [Planctomycetota bacterium]